MKRNLETWRVLGANADIDTGTEDLAAQGGSITFPSAAAATTVVSSSADDAAAGTGARTVRVGGLLAGGVVATEVVTLNGTSAVTCANQYLRILPHLCAVLTAGTGGSAAGAIDIKHSSTVLARISIGQGHVDAAMMTVPAGRRARLTHVSLNARAGVAGTLLARVWARPSGGVWRAVLVAELSPTAALQDSAEIVLPNGGELLEAGTDIRLAMTASSDNMTALGALAGTLEAAY